MTLTDAQRAAPVDNLVRAYSEPAALTRSATGDGRTLHGHFAVFNQWAEIDSMREGHFMERVAPGAFNKTITSGRDRIKVLYDHGKDPQLGNKPLGQITELREDGAGVYYEVALLKTSYNDDFVIPAAEAGLLGASFRFSIDDEKWNHPRTSTRDNPERLKERTITALNVREFGPCTFPAYAGATASIRSSTDDYFESLNDPLFVARLTDRVGLTVVEGLLAASGTPRSADPERITVWSARNDAPSSEGDSENLEPAADGADEGTSEDPPTATSDSTTPEAPDDGEPGSGDRAADGPTEPRTFTLDERAQHARLIRARQAGLGKARNG